MADELDFSAAAKSLMLKPEADSAPALDFGAAAKSLAQGRAATTLRSVQDVNPDTAARALDLSKRSGLPLPAVEGSEDEVEGQLRAATVEQALDRAPTTRLFFADPTNAKIAHDDAEGLTALEQVWNVGRGFGAGVVDTPGMTARGLGEIYGVADRAIRRPVFAALDAIGASDVVEALKAPIPWWLSPEKILTKPGEVVRAAAQAIEPAAEDKNFATDVAAGLGQLTAQITAAILSGGASTAVSTATLLGQGASQQADMVKAAGAEGTAEADTAVVLGAGITAVTERFGLDALLNKIPVQIKTRVMRMLAGAGAEGAQEVVEGVLQNLTAVALYDPDNPIFEGVAYEGGVAASAGAIVSALIPGKQAQMAVTGKEQMDEADKAAKATKLNERSPEKFGELHGAMLREQGIDKIAIPAARLQEFMQDGEGDPNETMRNLGVADQMDEALAIGGDVELTPEAYSQYILGTDAYAKLSDHIRMDADGMTAAEAEEWLTTGVKDDIARVSEEMAKMDPAVVDDVATIQGEVETMLKAAGEAPDAATHAAVLTAQRYATRGERAGVSVMDLWRADGLSVVRGEAQPGEMEQPGDKRLPEPSTFDLPPLPDKTAMDSFGRVESVPIDKALSTQSKREWEKFNAGEHPGALIEGYDDKPVAIRWSNGEYLVIDGHHRTEVALDRGDTAIDMHVIDAKDYAPGKDKKPSAPGMSDNDILRSLFDQPARGSVSFSDSGIIVRLGANSDRSTFLHESGHLYLEQLRADARQFGATSPALVDDLNTVTDWWAKNADDLRKEAIGYAKKAKDTAAVAALEKMDVARAVRLGTPDQYLDRALHEQFARGTEDYFRNGTAPSVALQEAFNRFRAWLVSIYRAMKGRGLDVQFSPEVKAVMDRMLATDDEISLVEEQYNLKALFGSAEEIGMTPKQFEAYQRTVARASEEAKTAHLKKHLNQVERVKLDWWKEERAKMRAIVAPEIEAQPAYRAMFGLARGQLPNGEVLTMKPGRLDRAAVVEILESEEALARLPKVRGRGIFTTAKKEGGVNPDVIGQLYGYEDGRAMLVDLMNAAPIEDAIDSETDARMRVEFGDMAIDGTAVESALESTHNDKRGDVLAAELNALRESQPKMKTAFVRQWAKERIGTRKVDDIKPEKFIAAERRYGREAGKLLRAGDRLGAQRAKFQQLMNFYMAKESYNVRVEVEKARTYLEKFNLVSRKFPSIEADYIDNIRVILDAYQLGARLSERTQVKLSMQAVSEWVQKKITDDGAILEVPQRILDAEAKTHFRDLTLDEFRTLTDTIKNIEAQGRLAKTAIVDGQERDIAEMATEIVDRLEKLPQNNRVARKATEQNPGLYDRTLGKLVSADAALRKVEFILEGMDGEKNGPAHRYIFQTFADAEAARNDLTKSVTDVVRKAIDNLPAIVRQKFTEKVSIPLLGRTFQRSDLLMMALNVGNESNYNKMLDGSAKDINEGSMPWTEEGVDEALANLTAQEWDFVQTVWDAFESMYPKVQEIYRRENGVAPERVEPRAIETRHGQTLRGGYFPMMYDPDRSTMARDIENKSALEAMQSTVVKASVNSSMTKARTGFSAPVLLDIAKLPNHIERTAHFITHYEAVRATRRLLGKRDVAKAITNRVSPEYYQTLKNWVNELAANGQPANPTSIVGNLVETMRTNATVAIMGFSYTTMSAQILGYANSVDALARQPDGSYSLRQGSKWLATGMVQYLKNPAEAIRKVFAASGELRHRLQNTDRDIRHALKELEGKKGAWKQFQRFSLMGIAGVQLYMVDMPVWLGAYNRAVATGATAPDAVRAADSLLRTSQTAGGLKDLSAIQREPGVTKALTMFYSYFNLLYNLQAQAIGATNGAKDVPQLAARAFVLLALPTAAEAILKQEWPDDDEDYPAWVGLKTALYGLSSMPLVRDLVGLAEGFGYSLSPLDSFGESLGRSIKGIAKAIDDGEMSASTAKAIIGAIGFGVGAPVTQVNRIVGAADAMFAGEDVGPYDFLVGHKKEK